jgi:hypothetical protein
LIITSFNSFAGFEVQGNFLKELPRGCGFGLIRPTRDLEATCGNCRIHESRFCPGPQRHASMLSKIALRQLPLPLFPGHFTTRYFPIRSLWS